jgi:isopenicillin N synthase-like dioxygenase
LIIVALRDWPAQELPAGTQLQVAKRPGICEDRYHTIPRPIRTPEEIEMSTVAAETDQMLDNGSGVTAVNYGDPDAPAKFTDSLRRTGFGVIRNHPIPIDLIETIYAEWLAFFESDAKAKYRYGEKYDGFFPATEAETAKTGKAPDLKEYFHIYPWGQYPTEVSDAARRYYAIASDFAVELLGWVEDNTPEDVKARFSEPLSEMIRGTDRSLFRILRYPPLSGEEEPDAVRSAAHEDINLLTVLPAAKERGLQVMNAKGEWHDVPSDLGTLVVNVGDMLQEASGGYYKSTTHRVVNPTSEESKLRSRVSIPLFLHPRPEVVLSDRHTSGSYLAERLAELSRGRNK